MHIVLAPAPPPGAADGAAPAGPAGQPPASGPAAPWSAVVVDEHGTVRPGRPATAPLPELVRGLPGRLGVDPEAVRWVFASVAVGYPALLEAGIELGRCWDLGLCQRILSGAATRDSTGVRYAPAVVVPVRDPEPATPAPPPGPDQGAFFDLPARGPDGGPVPRAADLARELGAQLAAVAGARHPGRLRLLLAGESQGALVAAEMLHEGLPWRRDVHEAMLARLLGPRPPEGQRPARLQELAGRIGTTLGAPGLNPDSPQDLLRALRAAGVPVSSTRAGELRHWIAGGGPDTPRRSALLADVLEYKGLYRLWTANGWHWLDEWVHGGRFHPAYAVGSVVTGRWAAHGGGAMQVPAAVRDAVRADPGHVLTVADASQVEPRILAAMSGDRALAAAGSGHDLYLAVAEQGRRAGSEIGDRSRAKVALLGAMYGATTGDSAALMPHLRRLYPEAIGLLERAARAGEEGGQVSTWLGRTSPPPGPEWLRTVADVGTAEAESRARTVRRGAGRFTRNFVVQGTAAEWALCWMGEIRRRLREGGPGHPAGLRTRLVFFVHDEVVLHGPAGEAEAVERIVTESAEAAGRLLFGAAPVGFPLTVAAVESYADAH
ncbi:bifunctional 3'-5' exonuclease/DNA polymerase [Citricoccus sp. SGAir0253]|uniref:bifunctional 3'-5' exonuclease/DNA polymerase n=1 Tax=Citricoccus sp. SGAir0253 TaxID=2567881 RepID=UPI0010CD473A|nr:bifunctional 3'-5' exonuclease/DNA polymerase [Citricoccus sp. SGAir0253]QCU77644.1 bifunctional 3'-5' exonuclease/DNA polymerase [Citricoccus sp. SGAir0253]